MRATDAALAAKVLTTPRFTRWRVLANGRMLASVPCNVAGTTEAEALAWAHRMFPEQAVTVEGVR